MPIFLIVYAVLFVVLVALSISSLRADFSYTGLIIQIGLLLGWSRLVFQELQKKHLPLYFWWERQKVRWWYGDSTSKWWFHARYDGIQTDDVFEELDAKLKDSRFKIKTLRGNNREREFQIDDSLYVTVHLGMATDSPDEVPDVDHIAVTSRVMEVSYGYAKTRLETQIQPFLSLLDSVLKPDSHSFELNVDFMGDGNPFFNVFIANLPASKVEDFRVVLHVDGNSPSANKDRIVISSKKIKITADSPASFNKLAQDYLLLTPDTRHLVGARE